MRTVRLGAFAALVAAVVFTLGCGSKKTIDRPVEDFPKVGEPAKLAVTAPGGGAEKVKLRWTGKPGHVERMTMDLVMKMKMSMKVPGLGGDIPMTFVIDAETKEVHPNGDITFEWRVVDFKAKAGGMMAEAMASAGDMVKDMKFGGKMDSRGKFIEFDMGDMASLGMGGGMGGIGGAGNLDQLMQYSSAIFPEEAIAVGGTWEQLSTVELNGLKLRQLVTCELTEVAGSNVTIKMKLLQEAGSQTMDMGMGSATFDKMATTGEVTMKMDLSRPWAIDSKGKVKQEIEAEIKAMGQSQDFEMSIDMDLDVSSKPAPPKPKEPADGPDADEPAAGGLDE